LASRAIINPAAAAARNNFPRSALLIRMATTETPTHPSIISMINQDHARFKSMWSEYNGPNMNGEMKQKLAWALIREIAMHSSSEEEVMYPEVRKRLGDEAADHLLGLEGHQKLKDLLYEANNMTIEKNG
ncbi:hypothetical protein Agub_g15078, partial [Astrephomene gubernaculifera]